MARPTVAELIEADNIVTANLQFWKGQIDSAQTMIEGARAKRQEMSRVRFLLTAAMDEIAALDARVADVTAERDTLTAQVGAVNQLATTAADTGTQVDPTAIFTATGHVYTPPPIV